MLYGGGEMGKREQIEQDWIDESSEDGKSLCRFINDKDLHYMLIKAWIEVWYSEEREHSYIHNYFYGDQERLELSYLCRALTLNMLLDDNEGLLK